jgi:hypothetical protein
MCFVSLYNLRGKREIRAEIHVGLRVQSPLIRTSYEETKVVRQSSVKFSSIEFQKIR